MNQPDTHPSEDPVAIDAALRETAARWIVRRDRGLSAAESIEFELWLAADERHALAIQRADAVWAMLDRIPEDVAQSVLAKPPRRWARYWLAAGGLAAAVAMAAFFGWERRGEVARHQQRITMENLAHDVSRARVMTLADGSTVRLNVGSEIVEAFTPAERRIIVARGARGHRRAVRRTHESLGVAKHLAAARRRDARGARGRISTANRPSNRARRSGVGGAQDRRPIPRGQYRRIYPFVGGTLRGRIAADAGRRDRPLEAALNVFYARSRPAAS
jgi:hypothetical protein